MVITVIHNDARQRARNTLVDCIHHTDAELDAAAQVLSKSPRPEDTRLAAMWFDMRQREAS